MAYKGIGEYGLIGNSHTAALVGVDGSIDWCCLPRFDSPSTFAAILDDVKGGRFQIKPSEAFRSDQAYIPNTNVLQTTFKTDTGKVTAVDFMPCYRTARSKLTHPAEIYRIVNCSDGEMELEAIFEPRLDYARGKTIVQTARHGVIAGKDTENVSLSSTIQFAIDSDKSICSFKLHKDQSAEFVLRYGSSQPKSPAVYRPYAKLECTVAYWRKKAEACDVSGTWREQIVRSYLALHLMLYTPTGAVIAAPTTSLPEEIGGGRNWDYRYAWLRDASLTLGAFFRLGHTEEGLGFFNWLVTLCDKCGAKAQILYDIDYEHPVDEQILEHLEGYKGSKPVRIGNGAYNQTQLDVFGEMLDAAHNFLEMGGYISRGTWQSMESFVEAACDNWKKPDSGIWEIRGGPYHFVHSKLMCWVAVDRGIRIAERLGYGDNLTRWRQVAKEIHNDISENGWNANKKAFTQHYDTEVLDSSNLLMPLFDFLPITDERIISTLERTKEELSWKGLLRRYRTDLADDGLSGSEGAFLWCTFWLVRNTIRMGELEEAKALYNRLLSYSNHLGLISEMVDPDTGELLGNFPQALTHLAIIITGLELTDALEKKKA
jgi:GH15 family glucan-1,4-alpha-glucosidase